MFSKFLRIATVGFEELVQINESTVIKKMTPNDGLARYMEILAGALGFSHEFVYPSDENSGGRQQPDGSWTGELGMIERGEADMSTVVLNWDLNEYFLMSYPTEVREVTFMTRNPEHVPDPLVFLHPFSIPVWISVIAFLFIMPVIFGCLMQRKRSLLTYFSSTLRSLVGQGVEFEPQKPREYFLLAFWILISALLCLFYAAVLLSFVTYPTLHGIRTIEDLAKGVEEGKYYCTTYPSATYASIFSNSSDLSLQAIGHSLEQNDGTDDIVGFLETFVVGKKPVYVGLRSHFLPYKDIYFISEENFFFSLPAFVLRKDFCCKSELDEFFHRLWSSGILHHLEALDNHWYFIDDSEKYGKKWNNLPSEVQLTVTIFKGPFVFLIFFHVLSFSVFSAEICIGKLNHVTSIFNLLLSLLFHLMTFLITRVMACVRACRQKLGCTQCLMQY